MAPGPRGSDAEAAVAAPAEEAPADPDESDEPDIGTEFVLEFSGDPAREFRASFRLITNAGNLARRYQRLAA